MDDRQTRFLKSVDTLLLSLVPTPARLWRRDDLAGCVVACRCPECVHGECVSWHPVHPGGHRDG